MELEFDNEIDALLRKEAGRTITISEFAGLHLDADEIAAFAEGAVPERARQTFMQHFAACDQCRKTLSHAVLLNAAEVPETAASVAAPVQVSVPWYRRLFLFPNLAYVMGGLVVLFAGFIGLSVMTRNYQGPQSDVSQIAANEARPAAAPVPAETFANSNAAAAAPTSNSAMSASNAASNSAANFAAPNGGNSAKGSGPGASRSPEQPAQLRDDVKMPLQQPSAGAPAPPPPPAAAETQTAVVTADGVTAGRAQRPPAKSAERPREEKLAEQTSNRSMSSLKRKAPERQERIKADETENDFSSPKDKRPAPATGAAANTGRKQVSGKTFEFRQGAWYDTTFRGEGTVNVRRNTDDYRKLDSGLRRLADSFMGTVVVAIWNGRAYRIQ